MATPIKRIEKDFLLKVLYDEQLPLMLKYARNEYVLFLEQPPKLSLVCRANDAVAGLKLSRKLELLFDYRGQTVTFSTRVEEIKGPILTLEAPEFLYKNLDRAFSRVPAPSDMQTSFSFHGERYQLSFPRTDEYFPVDEPDYNKDFNITNIRDLVSQLSSWALEIAGNHKLVMFKDKPAESTEEKLIARSARAFFIPYTAGDFPSTENYGDKPVITEGYFKQYLEENGTDPVFTEEAIARFMSKKQKEGVYSDLWVPIPFHEYIIGYIHLWTSEHGRAPMGPDTVEAAFQFAKVIAASLKFNGYFKGREVKKEYYQGKCIDVSASGLLFAYPLGPLTASLLEGSMIDVQLQTGKRLIKTASRIVRRYKDSSFMYFGCRYTDIAPEDLRYLFEFIYGKKLTDSETPLDLMSGC